MLSLLPLSDLSNEVPSTPFFALPPCRPARQQTCLDSQADRLSLSVVSSPEITFSPDLLVGNLLLELLSDDSQTTSANASTTDGMDETGVMWNVSALSSGTSSAWTIFPSTGLLLPGQRLEKRHLVGQRSQSWFPSREKVAYAPNVVDDAFTPVSAILVYGYTKTDCWNLSFSCVAQRVPPMILLRSIPFKFLSQMKAGLS